MEELPPVRRFIDALLLAAIEAGASDIHIEPTEDGAGRCRLRIDGVLHEFELPEELEYPGEVPYGEVVNRLKLMAGVDLTERRLPQDGRIQLDASGRRVDLRANFLPAMHGERVAMRVFDREALQTAFDLDLIVRDEGQRELVRDLCHRPHGLVLCAGPTGSGKTTVLYAMLQEFNLDTCSAITIEDPVEYTFDRLVQVNVNPRIGRTFAVAARSVFRQDPDIVLIGEIRNEEVAMLAAQFALTGHVCLSSLNAQTAPVALRRLVDMGVPDFVVNSAVIGVICPRLVRMLCRECKAPTAPPPHSLPPEARALLDEVGEAQFHEPVGCGECNGTGYKGRMALFEVLIPDDGVKRVLAAGGDEAALREAAVEAGMKTLLRAGLEAASRGLTSVHEVLRVIPPRK
jgi:type II secretory ATPase GspE/PulE/Tfp pilus assembly ATPase PilB-like protein